MMNRISNLTKVKVFLARNVTNWTSSNINVKKSSKKEHLFSSTIILLQLWFIKIPNFISGHMKFRKPRWNVPEWWFRNNTKQCNCQFSKNRKQKLKHDDKKLPQSFSREHKWALDLFHSDKPKLRQNPQKLWFIRKERTKTFFCDSKSTFLGSIRCSCWIFYQRCTVTEKKKKKT